MDKFVYVIVLIIFGVNISNAGNKRALLIGISDYPHYDDSEIVSWNPIHGANDVGLIVGTLKKQGFNVVKLIDKDATASKIRTAFQKFSNECKLGDIIYIHFSGHGQPVEDLDGDESDGWDESIVPYDAPKSYIKDKYHGENHILDDELNEVLKTIRKKVGPNGYVAVAIDACHAGSSYRGEEEEDTVIVRGTSSGFSSMNKPFVPKIDKRSKIKIEQSATISPICLIEACRSYQVNREIKENGIYYGSLSFYLNMIFQKTSLRRDSSWAEEVSKQMAKDIRLIRQNVVIETSE